jgi:CheY-like chemotaxis protein
MACATVLCIDDSSAFLKVRKTNLERLGFSVLTATEARSALALLQHTPVSAVLVDYKLEGLDAEAVALHLKRRFPEIPLILLSAFSDLPERILWLFDEYVMKSGPPEEIAAIVNRITTAGRKVPSSEGNRAAGSRNLKVD